MSKVKISIEEQDIEKAYNALELLAKDSDGEYNYSICARYCPIGQAYLRQFGSYIDVFKNYIKNLDTNETTDIPDDASRYASSFDDYPITGNRVIPIDFEMEFPWL